MLTANKLPHSIGVVDNNLYRPLFPKDMAANYRSSFKCHGYGVRSFGGVHSLLNSLAPLLELQEVQAGTRFSIFVAPPLLTVS